MPNNTAQHTPGPWKMRYKRWPDRPYADAREVQFFGADGANVGFTMQGRVSDLTGNANARLIALAPELLAALARCVREGDLPVSVDSEARILIVKALGE